VAFIVKDHNYMWFRNS